MIWLSTPEEREWLTFLQAQKIKRTLSRDIHFKGTRYRVVIAPYSDMDLNTFLDAYPSMDDPDFMARAYSCDSHFRLVGVHDNGRDIRWINIQEQTIGYKDQLL